MIYQTFEIIEDNKKKLGFGFLIYIAMMVYGVYFYFNPIDIQPFEQIRIGWLDLIIYGAAVAGLFGTIYSLVQLFSPRPGFEFRIFATHLEVFKRNHKEPIRTVDLTKVESLQLDVVREGLRNPRVELFWEGNGEKAPIFIDKSMKFRNIDALMEDLMNEITLGHSHIVIKPTKNLNI